jgi:hypothetical protein
MRPKYNLYNGKSPSFNCTNIAIMSSLMNELNSVGNSSGPEALLCSILEIASNTSSSVKGYVRIFLSSSDN